MPTRESVILGIESSCDETSAAVLRGHNILANITAGQSVHKDYGGVVPELASRAHQSNIVPVVNAALLEAKITVNEVDAVAYTRGPGLMGSLLVGGSFAKAFALAKNIPLIPVNHMRAHVIAHFIGEMPTCPFICLTASGGHTQLIRVEGPMKMKLLGETTDDAAGEAFDKAAKILGLPYPGGPLIDKYASSGNNKRFSFPKTAMPGYNFSFSGIKTSLLYFVRKELEQDPDFIRKNLNDICASFQHTIVQMLIKKLTEACESQHVSAMAIAGGVSANSELRLMLKSYAKAKGWPVYIPSQEYCTDNAAMIAMAGYYQLKENKTGNQNEASLARFDFGT